MPQITKVTTAPGSEVVSRAGGAPSESGVSDKTEAFIAPHSSVWGRVVPRVGLGSLTGVRLMRKPGMCVFKERACPPLRPFQNLLKHRLQLS